MSKYSSGDKVNVLGVQGTVKSLDPGSGHGDGIVAVKLPDGSERFVMESYLDKLNKKAPAKKAPAPQPAPESEKIEEPKAKAAPKKKTTTKKPAAKKSTK